VLKKTNLEKKTLFFKPGSFGKGPVITFFFLFLGVFSLFAQQPKDVVLVVDTSASMSSYYNEVGNYLTGPFLVENLNFNDTLHIISFGSQARLELARRILEQGDIETVSGRIWLLYPLEPASDSAGALSYAEQYVKGNIPGGRPKRVFLISDDNAENLVQASVPRFRAGGAELFFIKAASRIVSPGNRGGTPRGTTAARTPASGTGGRIQVTPPETGGRTRAPEAGGGTLNPVSETVPPAGGTLNPVSETASPADGPAPETETEMTLPPPEDTEGVSTGDSITAGGETGGGSTAGISADNQASPPVRSGSVNAGGIAVSPFLLIAAGLLLLVILALIIFMKIRGLHSSPNKVMASAGSVNKTTAGNAELLNSFATRQAEASLQGPQRRYPSRGDTNQFLTNPPMLNLFVEEQNTAIGRRNVHLLKKGSVYTVGGGNSDFLIFLVYVPPGIGQIHFDGRICTFTPLKPQYFPDLGSTPVPECIGKTVRVLSDKNYELFFRFERFKDPLIVLNQLLHSIAVPETPGTPRAVPPFRAPGTPQ
jgi:hypothetical protein